MGSEASRTGIEGRTLELAGRLVEVEAPTHWTDARLEAWLDWADQLPGDWPNLAPAALQPEAETDGSLDALWRGWARRLALACSREDPGGESLDESPPAAAGPVDE